MARLEVVLSHEAEAFLDALPFILLAGGYKSDIPHADAFADELLDFVYSLPRVPSYSLSRKAFRHYKRYGSLLRYAFYRRGRTTWYVFFEQLGNRYIVHHISNNWTEGQYIR